VWVFLASYSALSILRTENTIFDSAAGSAVAGALTLGALAVTMGSGYTKYAEAIYAKPAAPPPPPPGRVGSVVVPAAAVSAALGAARRSSRAGGRRRG